MRWTISLALVCLSSTALAYNSEEHKAIGDRGSAAAITCDSLKGSGAPVAQGGKSGCGVFGKLNSARSSVPLLKLYDGPDGPPQSSSFEPGEGPDLVTHDWQRLYKSWAETTNKNYKEQWAKHLGQKLTSSHGKDEDFNKVIYIPSSQNTTLKSLKPLVVWVGTGDGKTGAYFTFGDLVALYGDFRKAVTCDETRHDCLLTDKLPTDAKATYQNLRAFAHGMTPPLGFAGNSFGDWERYGPNEPHLTEKPGWWGDEMMRLAGVNDWHFSGRAVAWYVAMHRLALHHVRLAVKHDDPTYLWQAIHYEANGLHSITDLFSPGHMVMNREASTDAIWKSRVAEPEKNQLYQWTTRVRALGVLGEAGSPASGLSAPESSYAPTSVTVSTSEASWAKWEESGHSSFNKNGAEGRTLAGTTFLIFGDSRLVGRGNPEAPASKEEDRRSEELFSNASKAVQEGLLSLLKAYSTLKAGRANLDATFQSLERNRATYFAALKYIPTELRRACYGHPAFCYGPGQSESHWRATRYRTDIALFLGMTDKAGQRPPACYDGNGNPTAALNGTLPCIDGRRFVIDPLYLAAYAGTSNYNSLKKLMGWKASSLSYALQSGTRGYEFDKGETQIVCKDHGLPVYEFSVLPWK